MDGGGYVRTLTLARRGSPAPEELHAVDPLILVGTLREEVLESPPDRTVAGVRKRDEDQAVVTTASFSPGASDRNEVTHAVRDYDPLLLGGEREHVLVGEPAQLLLLFEREYVMPCRRELPPDVPPASKQLRLD